MALTRTRGQNARENYLQTFAVKQEVGSMTANVSCQRRLHDAQTQT